MSQIIASCETSIQREQLSLEILYTVSCYCNIHKFEHDQLEFVFQLLHTRENNPAAPSAEFKKSKIIAYQSP